MVLKHLMIPREGHIHSPAEGSVERSIQFN